MGKRELVALFFWCLVIVVWLFLAVPWVCLHFVIVIFPDHTHLLFSGVNVIQIHLLSRALAAPLLDGAELVVQF